VLSAIGSIEIPRHEWDDLITSLQTTSSNEDMNIRLASLTTLMYLCDELQPDDLNDTLKNAILHSLITNVSIEEANLEATKLAVKALPNSIAYANNIFGNDTDRDFLMDKIFTACQLQDEEIQEYALHTLREIGI